MLDDFLGRGNSDRLLEELREGVGQLKALGVRDPQDWKEFVENLKVPTDLNATSAQQRITTNFLYYRGNYLLISAVVLFIFVVTSPAVIFFLLYGLCGAFAVYATRHRPLAIQGQEIDFRMRMAAFGVSSALVAVLSGAIGTLLLAMSVSGTAAAAHMLCKPPSSATKMHRFSEERSLQQKLDDVEGGPHGDSHHSGEMRSRGGGSQ